MKFLPLLASISVLGITAASAAPPNQPDHQAPMAGSRSEAVSSVKDTASSLVGKVSAEMTHTTQGFVTAAAISDMYEVEAGKIAAERSANPEIKDFAKHMISAHTETTDKLKATLKSNNISVTPPTRLDDRRQGMIDNLRGATAEDFDGRYAEQQEAAHEEARILLRGYAKDGDNAAVKQFASQTLPAVQEHLASIEKIEKRLKRASR